MGATCRLFEPYVWQIMGKLLDKFGDTTAFVRDANDRAAQTIMANLTSHGENGRGLASREDILCR